MKVELHLHTSRYSGCAVNTPSEMMRRLIEAGYDAVCITEHDAVWGADELADLRSLFPELRIFGGVELSLGMQHLLVLGTTDPHYLEITDEAEVLESAARADLPTVLAHPFRWGGGAGMLERGLRPDAIEHFTSNHFDVSADLAADTGGRLGVALVNAGDVHAVEMIDQFWIETDSPVAKASDLRRIILQGAYRNCQAEA
jgi:predicted metal-dependent phosphoesterase TrpH